MEYMFIIGEESIAKTCCKIGDINDIIGEKNIFTCDNCGLE